MIACAEDRVDKQKEFSRSFLSFFFAGFGGRVSANILAEQKRQHSNAVPAAAAVQQVMKTKRRQHSNRWFVSFRERFVSHSALGGMEQSPKMPQNRASELEQCCCS